MIPAKHLALCLAHGGGTGASAAGGVILTAVILITLLIICGRARQLHGDPGSFKSPKSQNCTGFSHSCITTACLSS